jgi:ABC-type transport system involved in multi-copper enzyme maturation permease subunit
MSLLRAELRRLFKRRFTKFMLAFVVLALGAIVVSFSFASHKIGPAEHAAAQATANRQVAVWAAQVERDKAACEQAKQTTDTQDDKQWPQDCASMTAPTAGDVPADNFLPYEFNFRTGFGNFISIFGGILALFAYAVGASYVGAEWSSGGMMNLLLWRPRRLPVLLTKLGAFLGSLLAIGVALGAVWTAALWLVAKYDGNASKVTQGAWESFAISGARALGLVAAVGVVGFGLASLGRHTAMALGAAVGLGVLSEVGLRIALTLANVSFPGRFILSSYAIAWFNKTLKLTDWNSCDWSSVNGCEPKTMTLTWQDSAMVFGVGTVVVLAAAIWMMRRRDIT